MSEVLILSTGVANTASIMAGLRRAGAEPRLATPQDDIARAPRVVLPGVGAFGAGMDRLRELDTASALASRIEAGRPTLAICLGLQLLCASSEEAPDVEGLGIVSAKVERFRGPVRVPQMGWNTVEPGSDCVLLEPGAAYFANSYRIAEAPEGWSAAISEHGEPFVAAMERGAVLACQFHPELSGVWGRDLLARWMARSGGVPC